MKKFSCFVLSLGLLVASTGMANDPDFEGFKTDVLKRMQEHINKLQENRTCVSNAKDRAAMKVCHDQMKEWHEKNQKPKGNKK
jgi:hypothetical protein